MKGLKLIFCYFPNELQNLRGILKYETILYRMMFTLLSLKVFFLWLNQKVI